MEPSQTALARALDALDAERVAISETRTSIAVNQLSGAEAEWLIGLFEAAGWTDIVVTNEGDELPRTMIATSTGVLRLAAPRPALPDTVEAVLTSAGFTSLLARDPAYPIVWVEGLEQTIDTLTVRYAPWGADAPFSPEQEAANPARVVRVLGNADGPGNHLGRWMLRSAETDVAGAAMAPWRGRAASRLSAALAQEIETDGRLLFRGPPPTRFAPEAPQPILAAAFAATQAAVKWVFENERELENRHGLVAAEVARTSLRNGTLSDLAATLKAALEGARIAYNFGVTQQSKDTLKALGDLRKAVSDDAAKLSETTRSLGTAVISAVFGNIGLIVARLTLPANGVFIGPAAMLIGAVLALYVASIIVSGSQYISIQKTLRKDWRDRLYRFLGDEEYERMVEHPAKRAECYFWITAGFGIVMTGVLLAAVYQIAAAPPAAKSQTSANGTVANSTVANEGAAAMRADNGLDGNAQADASHTATPTVAPPR